ncbi:unnamed protein product, partial [Larinioides sclopetarius]
GLLYTKSYVVAQCFPVSVAQKSGERVTALVLLSVA